MGVLYVDHHMDATLAILITLCTGALIGAFHGLVITRIGLPSFVVTLAGLIGWQGAQMFVLTSTFFRVLWLLSSIPNGMDLLSLQSSVKFMITGAVLLIAVTLDALAAARLPRVRAV